MGVELVAQEKEGDDYHALDRSVRHLRSECGANPPGGLVQTSREKAEANHYNACGSCFDSTEENQ